VRRTTIILALLFALVGGGATFAAILRASGARPADQGRVQVLVATRAIEMGAALRPSDFEPQAMRAADAPTDALHAPNDVSGRYALAPIAAAEPMRASRMSDQPPGSRLAQVIPDGHVAISVAVSDVISTGGQIAPGDYVDVLGVITKEATDTAQVVLTNVQVIAVSNAIAGVEPASTTKSTTSKAASNPRGLDTTITLAVTISEAQRLVQVDEVGKLRLALRRRADLGTTAFR
jgi:pilus assembly protein CpaB